MGQCLDPSAAVRSVSLEKRLLFGTALAVVGATLLSGGGDGTLLGEVLGQGVGDASIIDAVIGAVAGFAGLDAAISASELAGIAKEVYESTEGATDSVTSTESIEFAVLPLLDRIGEVAKEVLIILSKYLRF
eukprot:CAMPEP_0198152528 /NCGR_PEP_ID=MMETSP1443-20131203/60197_1 /TAXON_ID=186043 /ORGANISM="Entomoneis sp., Strain CCMP2396" /LENGTH=131 /DNA_ID=CAMNT_0043818581 /DNA_START=44 /DNA_END=439 /DNA_ORIENTATION=-